MSAAGVELAYLPAVISSTVARKIRGGLEFSRAGLCKFSKVSHLRMPSGHLHPSLAKFLTT